MSSRTIARNQRRAIIMVFRHENDVTASEEGAM
jgi:hypothetical protein